MSKEEIGFASDFEDTNEALRKDSEIPKKGEKEVDQVTFTELDGGDSSKDFSMDDDTDDNFEEETEVDTEEDVETEETEEEEKEEVDDATAKEVLKVLDGETIVKSKGKEYKLKDLPKDQLKEYIQKGLTFYKDMEGLSEARKDIEQRERALVEQTATANQRLLESLAKQVQSGKTLDDNLPDNLKPNEYDTDEVKGLKQVLGTILNDVKTLKGDVDNTSMATHQQAFVRELETLVQEFPAASIDEVMAIKDMRPDIPTRDIVEASHKHYASMDFLDKVFKAVPELKREYDEGVITAYKSNFQKTKKQASRRSGGTVTKKTSEGGSKPIKSFEDADSKARQYLNATHAMDED